MFSSITITFAPAIVYFASSPKIPIGICSPNSAAGCVMGMCSLQCFQYASTSASFQETFRFSWAIEGKVCMNEWMGETCKLVGTKSIYLSIFYLSVIYIYISIYLSIFLSIYLPVYLYLNLPIFLLKYIDVSWDVDGRACSVDMGECVNLAGTPKKVNTYTGRSKWQQGSTTIHEASPSEPSLLSWHPSRQSPSLWQESPQSAMPQFTH